MSRERSFRTEAIILKRRDFGEADRLLTIITPEHGKRDVIAKGARKVLSTKTGHVEPFTLADMLIHRGRELDIAAQVEMLNPFVELREDLQRGAYGHYVAELMDRFVIDADEELDDAFALLKATLQHLCTDDDPRRVVRYYEMHLLDIVGFRPELQECVLTHEDILPEDQFFSYAEGGIVSPKAAHLAPHASPVSLNALKLMRFIQRSPYSQLANLHIAPGLHAEIERLMLGYITFLLEKRLQSVDFIRRIRK
ncbi:MAG: DNA repair protein RecO [Anaerolineae bacterium]